MHGPACRDPMSMIQPTPSTSMRDTLDQLRELSNTVKKRTKKKEEEEEPGHYLRTADTGSEQPEEERRQMNEIPYQ